MQGIQSNPWANMTEAQKWVSRKHMQHESTSNELSKCEYVSTTVITFICCSICHIHRALAVTAVASTAKQFKWNSFAELCLLLVDYIGYLTVQMPTGYLCDNRMDILGSKTGVDKITGEKSLNTGVEQTIGGAIFGSNQVEILDVEPWSEQMDKVVDNSHVQSDIKDAVPKSKSRIWRRFNKLKKQMAAQYTKYGPRYVLGSSFVLWGLLQLVVGVVSTVSHNKVLIYLLLVFRFFGGAAEGAVMVASQALVGKEVVPKRMVEHSQVIGMSYPLGCLLGILISIKFSDEYGVTAECMTWIAAIALLFSVVVFIWLAGSIDETIDRGDLLQRKEELLRDKIPDPEKETACRSCCRGCVRVGMFSYFEGAWLLKFRGISSMVVINALYWFAIHTVTAWLPSRVHAHKDYMTEVLAVTLLNKRQEEQSDLGISDLQAAELIDALPDEIVEGNPESAEENLSSPINSGGNVATINKMMAEIDVLKSTGILSEAEYKASMKKLVASLLTSRRLAEEENDGEERDLMEHVKVGDLDIDYINSELINAALNAARAENDNEIGVHNQVDFNDGDSSDAVERFPTFKQYADGTFDIGTGKILPMYSGMFVASLISNVFSSYMHRNNILTAKACRIIPMLMGTLCPAALFLYSGVALTNLTDISHLEYDQIFTRASWIFASAVAISGLCMGTLVSSQCHTTPFKTGSVYAIISVGGGFGMLAAALFRTLISHVFGDYILLTSMISAGSFILAFFIWMVASDYEIIEELAPVMQDGSPSKRLKLYK